MSIKTQDSKRIRNKKRILSVTIRRMIDESPDTSWLGEYSNRPANEFAIDRAHSEDCESLRLGFDSDGEWQYWNGTAEESLNRVRTFLEGFESPDYDHESSYNGCAEGCQACADEEPYNDAIETVWELERSAGECDCHGGDMERNQFRYFNPSFNYVTKEGRPADGLTPEDVRKYTRQDYERMESLNAGNWCFVGIRAEAEVQLTGDLIQRITSGGLWGIESDSDKGSYCDDPRHATPCVHDTSRPCPACVEECNPKHFHKNNYIQEVQNDELSNLKTELLALGFSKRAIATAFKDVQEEN